MYSKLLSWEVWNFESIEHGKAEFDERGILNFKGYNDSGKSAMLFALKLLMTNSNPTKQVDFIQDDKDYFRVLATFDDGVQVLRDKYINGQSLYEMYKDGKCIFTTKSEGGALTRVSNVPQPVADYLGLIVYDTDCMNIRTRHDELLGVSTGGSKNYKMFNTVLMSEEIAVASELINTDRNKLLADINSLDSQVEANKALLGTGRFLTENMISYLKSSDSTLDSILERENAVSSVQSLQSEVDDIVIQPELPHVDVSRLGALQSVLEAHSSLDNIISYPELPFVNTDRLQLLCDIGSAMQEQKGVEVTPELGSIDAGAFELLDKIGDVMSSIDFLDGAIRDIDIQLAELPAKMKELEMQVKESGLEGMVRCPDCGHVFHGADCALC